MENVLKIKEKVGSNKNQNQKFNRWFWKGLLLVSIFTPLLITSCATVQKVQENTRIEKREDRKERGEKIHHLNDSPFSIKTFKNIIKLLQKGKYRYTVDHQCSGYFKNTTTEGVDVFINIHSIGSKKLKETIFLHYLKFKKLKDRQSNETWIGIGLGSTGIGNINLCPNSRIRWLLEDITKVLWRNPDKPFVQFCSHQVASALEDYFTSEEFKRVLEIAEKDNYK